VAIQGQQVRQVAVVVVVVQQEFCSTTPYCLLPAVAVVAVVADDSVPGNQHQAPRGKPA
jgi:hypothetical protein